MLLEYFALPYEDEVIWGPTFAVRRPLFPFGKVPLVVVEFEPNADSATNHTFSLGAKAGKTSLTIAQSGSLARLAGMLGSDCRSPTAPGSLDRLDSDACWSAHNDSIFELAQEMCTVNPTLNCYTGQQFARAREFVLEDNIPSNLSYLERQMREVVIPRFAKENLEKNKGNDADVFFGGLGRPSIADFNVFHMVDNAQTLARMGDSDSDVFNETSKDTTFELSTFPSMCSWMQRMWRLPGLKEYLERRPKVVDVGVDPGLKDRNGTVIKQREGNGHCWVKDGLFVEELG